jgi:hypothetical protein
MERKHIYEIKNGDVILYCVESKEFAESICKSYSNYSYVDKLAPITNQDWLATLTPNEFILWLWGQGKGSLHELIAYNTSRESCLRNWLQEIHKDE